MLNGSVIQRWKLCREHRRKKREKVTKKTQGRTVPAAIVKEKRKGLKGWSFQIKRRYFFIGSVTHEFYSHSEKCLQITSSKHQIPNCGALPTVE